MNKKIVEVFLKGAKVRGKNPNLYRKDTCGNILYLYSYGKHSKMGWEKDHIIPKSKKGSDHISNLQPLKTRVNRSKQDKLTNYCNR